MTRFSDNLKALRKRHKMNQSQVAKYLGVGQTSVANYEKGIRIPNQDMLRKLAVLFDTTTDFLVGMEEVIDSEQRFSAQELKTLQSQFLAFVLNNDESSAIDLIISKARTKKLAINLIEHVIVDSMYQVGKLWYEGQIDVAKEHFITNVARKILGRVSGVMEIDLNQQEKTAICLTYYDELHTMGIEIVSEYLRILGYRVFNLGSTVPEPDVIKLVEDLKAELVAISISRSMYIDELQQMVERLREHFSKDSLKIIVGGQGIVRDNQMIIPLDVDGFASDFESLEALISKFS